MIPDDPELRYSLLAAELIRLVDRGASMTVEEVDDRIFDGSLLDWIDATHGGGKLLGSPVLWNGYDRAMVVGAFRALATTHPRYGGFWRNGLCLLIAYCIEILRDPSSWEDPQDDPSFPRT